MVGNIAANNITFSDSAVAGTTQVTVKAINFSDNASANVKKNDVIPINKTITITAENKDIKNYAMSINVSTTTTGGGMTTDTGNGMTTTGSSVVPIVIGTITGAQLAIAGITASGATLSGSFTKVNNPHLTELGILVTTNAMLNLELTNTNDAPTGAIKLSAPADQLALVNIPAFTVIPLSSFTVPNLASFTTYYFRGYAAISGGGVTYTDKINRKTLASKVNISNFTVSLPYNAAAMNLDGYFQMDYAKDPSSITSFGVLITSGTGVTLTLNGENPPAGARLIRGNTTAIAAANASANGNGTLTLSATNLALGRITYSFRGYVQNDVGITYTNISRKTTPSIFTPIPDDNFRNAILSCINTNGMTTLSGQTSALRFGCTESFEGMITASDNNISTAALLSITQFNYGTYDNKPDNLKISSLSGVEQMVNLTQLSVENNSISNLDVSENIALTTLIVNTNSLSNLDIAANTALISLLINNNSLSSLDISQNTALENLIVNNNSLSSLDVSNNIALTVLYVDNNSLSSLNIAANIALETLTINNNELSSLDVAANIALILLNVSNNRLSSLDVATNIALIALDVRSNSLTCIMVGTNTIMTVRKDDDKQTLSESCP